MPFRILIVEDDPDLREILRDVFAGEGYQPTAVTSPAEALQALDTQVFALVLTDAFASSPGDDLVEKVSRTVARARPTPVGVITGWRVEGADLARTGAKFHILKPFDLGDLLVRVAQALGEPLPAHDPRARVAAAYFAALDAKDWDALAALCTEDVRYALPAGTHHAASIEGREAFREFSRKTFSNYPDATFGELIFFRTPGGVACRFASTWTSPAGAREQSAGSVLLQLRDGRIARIGVEMNPALLARMP